MAVDTAAKRFSMLGFGGPLDELVLVPDGTIDAADRADLIRLYSGISLGEAVEPEPEPEGATGGWLLRRPPTREEERERVYRQRVAMGIVEAVEAADRRFDPRGERDRALEAGAPTPPMADDEADARLLMALEAWDLHAANLRRNRVRAAVALLMV